MINKETRKMKIRGDYGENAAAEYLKRHGYKILNRNWRCRYGELDIIASDGHIICFVEVKTRIWNKYASRNWEIAPRDAVGYRKREKLKQTALLWLDAWRGENPGRDEIPARFDIIEIYLNQNEKINQINYIINAFE